MTTEHETFSVGQLMASPQHNTIELGQRTIKLQPKVMEVLCYLAKHHDRVISNDELLDQVWGGRIVTHSSIQKSINALRTALAELDDSHEYIVHYSKRGYQLLGSVQEYATSLASRPVVEPPLKPEAKPKAKAVLVVSLISLLCLSVIFALVLKPSKLSKPKPWLPHAYIQATPLLEEGGGDSVPEPDWVNHRLAFVQTSKPGEDYQNKLIIRHASGAQWTLSTAQGEFIDLAWSPSGRNLLALERQSREGRGRSADFYGYPNNYYSIQVFTLDFKGERLIEKNSLSHWQGKIDSVTWWDENTLELVAAQGVNPVADRYRYAIGEQQLSKMPLAEATTEPLLSKIFQQRTALLSRDAQKFYLEFYTANNRLIGRWPLPQPYLDMSWLPDGSGVLLLAESGEAMAVYEDGSQTQIALPQTLTGQYTRLRATGEANTLLCAVRQPQVDVQWLQPDGGAVVLHEDNAELKAAQFLANGSGLIYALGRKDGVALWQLQQSEKRLLWQSAESIDHLQTRWSQTADYFYLQVGEQVNQLGLASHTLKPLFRSTTAVEVLKVESAKQQFWVVTDENRARNIWLIESGNRKQLTYGSLGTTLAGNAGIYFQYTAQMGTWLLDTERNEIRQIETNLPAHSRMLAATESGIYYVTGGECRESAIYFLDMKSGVNERVLSRTGSNFNTLDYAADSGVIQANCTAGASNLFRLQQ